MVGIRTKPPSYFECIIQLRDCGDEVFDFLVSYINKQTNPDNFISKVVQQKTGVDVYISSNKLGGKITSVLPKKFGGRAQTSSKLFSRDKQTSKNQMRLTVVYRGLDFKVGDVLALPVKRTVIKVVQLGTTVRCKDLGAQKMTGFVPNRSAYRILEKHKTRVVTLKPKVQILDPETYQSVIPRNSPPVNMNEEVKVVNWLGWWIVK